MKTKKFDAVKMMRDIRDKLLERYIANPEQETKELEEIRKEYHIKGNRRSRQNT
jgi:hypothetical protein